MSGWRRPETWILRDDGNGPVVTCGSAPFAVSVAVERGAESGMAASVARVERRPGSIAMGEVAFAEAFLSLRRHDPDQVQRVSRSLAVSQPLRRGTPWTRGLSAGCHRRVKRCCDAVLHARCASRRTREADPAERSGVFAVAAGAAVGEVEGQEALVEIAGVIGSYLGGLSGPTQVGTGATT